VKKTQNEQVGENSKKGAIEKDEDTWRI